MVVKSRQSKRLMFLIWLLGCLSIVVLIPVYNVATLDRRPPVVQFTSAEAFNSPISPGSYLGVRFYREKIRNDCPVSTNIEMVDVDGQVMLFHDGSDAPGGSKDEPAWTRSFHIPANTDPGTYILRSALSYQCPGISLPFTYDLPVVPFRVKLKDK
ncbi:MAG: hypothetical protein AAFZ46_12200 [Pseudomonadota bacterium]